MHGSMGTPSWGAQHLSGDRQVGCGKWRFVKLRTWVAVGLHPGAPSGFILVCIVRLLCLPFSVYILSLLNWNYMYWEYQLQKPTQCIFICNQGLNKTKISFGKEKDFALVPCKPYHVNHCCSATQSRKESEEYRRIQC